MVRRPTPGAAAPLCGPPFFLLPLLPRAAAPAVSAGEAGVVYRGRGGGGGAVDGTTGGACCGGGQAAWNRGCRGRAAAGAAAYGGRGGGNCRLRRGTAAALTGLGRVGFLLPGLRLDALLAVPDQVSGLLAVRAIWIDALQESGILAGPSLGIRSHSEKPVQELSVQFDTRAVHSSKTYGCPTASWRQPMSVYIPMIEPLRKAGQVSHQITAARVAALLVVPLLSAVPAHLGPPLDLFTRIGFSPLLT